MTRAAAPGALRQWGRMIFRSAPANAASDSRLPSPFWGIVVGWTMRRIIRAFGVR